MSNTAQCPVCGRAITKEQFLKNKICPNPMCATELDDEEELLEAFGLLQGNEDNDNEPEEEEDLLSQLIKGSNRYHDTAPKTQKKAANLNNFLTGAPASNNIKKETPQKSNESKSQAASTQSAHSVTTEPTEQQAKPKTKEPEFVKTESYQPASEIKEKSKDDVISELLKKLEAYETGEATPAPKSTPAQAESVPVTQETEVIETVEVETAKEEEKSLELQPDAFRAFSNNKKEELENIVDVSVPHVEKVVLNEEEIQEEVEEDKVKENEPVTPEKELTSAEKLRMRLKGSNPSTNEDIDKVVEEKYEKTYREVDSDEYDSNYDGYYDDAESDMPPVPDTINMSTIRTVIIALLFIVGLSAFLIYYI